MISLFGDGFKGLSNSLWSGIKGSSYRMVGLDIHSTPGVATVAQKLSKISGSVVTALCTSSVALQDGSTLWFGGNKVWREVSGVFTEVLNLNYSTRSILFNRGAEHTFLDLNSSVVRFNSTGTTMYVSSYLDGNIKQYELSTPYDPAIKTLVYTYSIASVVSFFVTDSRLFILFRDNVKVYRIASGSIQTALLLTTWSISGSTTHANDIGFKSDGLHMYIIDQSGTLYDFTLSSAWGGEFPEFRMVLVAGGGSAGSNPGLGVNDRGISGNGGSGGAVELFGEYLAPTISHSITIGAGGVAPSAGNNDGNKGSDTVAFGKTIKGGGFGARVNTDFTNNLHGGYGGNGGNNGRLWDNDGSTNYSGTPGGADTTGTYRVTGRLGISPGKPGGGAGKGTNLVSDISGASYTYSPDSPANGTANSAGSAGTRYGEGGKGTHWLNNGAVTYAGGAGYQGVVVLRFKTALVSYSQTGGTVTTSGSDTIITWTANGTFSYTLTAVTVTLTDTHSLPATTQGFAIENNRLLIVDVEKVSAYTLTGYDISSATLNEALVIDRVTDGVTARALVLTDDYLFVSYETDTENVAITRYEFNSSATTIINAHIHGAEITQLAQNQILLNSLGNTAQSLNFTSFVPDGSSKSLVEVAQSNIFAKNATASASYVRSFYNQDLSQTLRGYLTARTGTSLSVTPTDVPAIGKTSDLSSDQQMSVNQIVADAFILSSAIAESSGNDGMDTAKQPYLVTKEHTIDTVTMKFREGEDLRGGYDLILEIKDDIGGVVATDTVTINPGDIGLAETLVTFSFTALTFEVGVRYTIEVHVDNLASLNFSRTQNRYLVTPVKVREAFNIKAETTIGDDVEMQMQLINSTVVETEEEVVTEERIYFCTNNNIFYIKVSDATSSWVGKIVPVGAFKNGGDVHPMAVQNLRLFIGDANILSEVNESGTFIKETTFNLSESETITALRKFDLDILVGSSGYNYGLVRRWDTISDSWSTEDDVELAGGVNAFVGDDNYVYVQAGNYGHLYFYNGEKMEVYERLIGDFKQKTGKVYNNAVGFFLGIPLFGFSNLSNNPALQGVYSLGSFSRGYAKVIDLTYPLSVGTFDGVTIGSILVVGDTFYVSWQSGASYGVDKIDYTAKYASAYIESRNLAGAGNRHQIKTLSDVHVPYYSLPASTGITIGVKKNYETNYVSMNVMTDDKRKLVKLKNPSVKDVANPQLRIGFTVNANNAPVIEDVLFDMAPIGNK